MSTEVSCHLDFSGEEQGVEDKGGTFFPPLEPAVVCSPFVHLDGHSEIQTGTSS